MDVGSFAAPDPTAGVSSFRTSTGGAALARPLVEVDTPSIARVRRGPAKRIGIIVNHRAHRNLAGDIGWPAAASRNIDWVAPHTRAELSQALARFASRGVDTLVIDGGDGTIRDVLSAAPAHFAGGMPRLALIPSGKTNALAIDLGMPRELAVAAALDMIKAGHTRQRSPIEIFRDDEEVASLRGFLFGAGGFVRGTQLAQGTHRLGAFRGVAVGLALTAAIAQTAFGSRTNAWRRGERMRVTIGDGASVDRDFYLMLGSTLKRLPLGLKPFGRVRDGLKLLGIDAPPRRMVAAVPALLSGSEAPWLARAGYHRKDCRSVDIAFDSEFILDGEHYPGGALTIRQGAPLDFYVP